MHRQVFRCKGAVAKMNVDRPPAGQKTPQNLEGPTATISGNPIADQIEYLPAHPIPETGMMRSAVNPERCNLAYRASKWLQK